METITSVDTYNVTAPLIIGASTLQNSILTSAGPQFARQSMHFNNHTVVSKVPEDMLHLIDTYWVRFPPLHPIWHKVLGLVMIVLGIIGWCGNGVVVYVFIMTPGLRTPSNLLVVNLAFSDFLMMGIQCPPMVICCFYETWVLGKGKQLYRTIDNLKGGALFRTLGIREEMEPPLQSPICNFGARVLTNVFIYLHFYRRLWPLMCDIYAMVGSLCGCASIWTMTAIALDRYNVIVKGMSGKPLTIKLALLEIVGIWLFGLIWTILPMVGWNRYVPEGNMTACGTDYLSLDWVSKSYILVYSVFVYYTPLFTIIYSYYFIVSTVAAHERGMREQAKKMNVASLRSGETQGVSAEAKLAKVALTTISLWFMAWTPYLVINYIGIFNRTLLTPLFTIWGSLFAKANAIYNPIVYAISHPKYKAGLKERLPFLVCGSAEDQAAAGGEKTSEAAGN